MASWNERERHLLPDVCDPSGRFSSSTWKAAWRTQTPLLALQWCSRYDRGCSMKAAVAVVLPVVWATAQPEAISSQPARKANTDVNPELAFYRKYTEGLLRRYMKLSMEAGRAPSLLGREMFRGKVTQYRVHSFDDVVIFVHDVESCLKLLDTDQNLLITRIALQEYTQTETAAMLNLPVRTLVRRYEATIDRLTRLFLERRLLEPLVACQDVEIRP